MPAQPDAATARSVRAALEALGEAVFAAEDELSVLTPLLGDRDCQAALEDYLDQVLDTLRGVGEEARLAVAALPPRPLAGLDATRTPGSARNRGRP